MQTSPSNSNKVIKINSDSRPLVAASSVRSYDSRPNAIDKNNENRRDISPSRTINLTDIINPKLEPSQLRIILVE